MAKINKCDGCEKLNKRKKKSPCELGFNCIFVDGIYKRPSKCKNKVIKQNPQKELKKYKERAIDAFQKWIRYRDNFTCVVCGFTIDKEDKEAFKLMHAGHYISRRITNLLLDEKNVHSQCRNCNFLQDKLGVHPKYTIYLLNKYGEDIFHYFSKKIDEDREIDSLEKWKNLAAYWENKLQEIRKK